jgi:TP901 family phage tail tape measure protein
MPNLTNNIQFGGNASDLEAAAQKAIAILNAQGAAVQSLMIKEIEYNKAGKASLATVEAILDGQNKAIGTLKNYAKGWDVSSLSIKENTKALNEQERAAKKAQDQADKLAKQRIKDNTNFLGNLQKGADRVRSSQQRELESDDPTGRKAFLSPSDFARIAEATIFKSILTAFTSSLTEAIDKSKEFEIQISLIRTVSQDAQLSMDQWAEGIREVAGRLGIDVVQAAKAAYDAIQSQVVTGPQTLQFLEAAGQLARTTGSSIKVAGDLLASVIQGFNQGITEANHTAAVLFKTVELGRIQMDELSHTMGRIAPSANSVGIRLEEVSAALATLTRQGVRTSDASTLVTNIILKLAKPTEEMTKLINSWGFASAAAAVKTLGFVNVLRKLEEASHGGRIEELASFFNELRGLRGAVGLTSAFEDFEKDLKKIDQAEDTFAKAQIIRAESSADKLTKFAESAKGVFVNEFGREVLRVLANVVDALGGGDNAARVFSNAVIATSAAAIAGKLSLAGYAVVHGILEARLEANILKTRIATASQDAYNAAIVRGLTVTQAKTAAENAAVLAGKNSIQQVATNKQLITDSIGVSALLTAALLGVATAYDAIASSAGKANYSTEANLARIAENIKNINSVASDNAAKKNLDTFTDRVKNAFRIPLKLSAEQYKTANDQLEALKDTGKKLAEEFGITYKGYIDNIKDGIKELNKEITRSKDNIKQSRKSAAEFSDTLDDIIRKTQFKYATDQQKLLLQTQNIRRLTEEAERLFAQAGLDKDPNASEESAKRARQKFDEIARLLEEQFDLQKQLEIESTKESGKANGLTGTLNIAISTIPLQNKLNDLLSLRNKLETDYQKSQERSIKLKEQDAKKEEERLRRIEETAKKFINFDIYKNGKVDEKYLTNGKIDQQKILQDLTSIVGELEKLTPDAKGVINFYEQLYARVRNIVQQSNTEVTKKLAEEDQNRLLDLQKKFIEQFKKAQETIANLSQQAFSKGGQLDLLKADAGSLVNFTDAGPGADAETAITRFAAKYLNLNPDHLRAVGGARQFAKEAADKLKAYQDAADNIKKNAQTVQGQLIPRQEDVDVAIQKFKELEAAVKNYIITLSPQVKDHINDVLLPGKGGKDLTLGNIVADFEKQAAALKAAAQGAEEQQAKLKKLEQDLVDFYQKGVVPLIQQFPVLLADGDRVNNQLKQGMDAFRQSVEDAIDAVKRLQKEMSNVPAPNQKINVADVGDDDAEYFATGGFVHPGKPRGTDKIPAWLSPGEYVLNAMATKRFYSQIVAMNNGRQPRYYHQGGYVTTNIGDVHVHLTHGGQSAPNGRAIGRELKRELRRGNIKLGSNNGN